MPCPYEVHGNIITVPEVPLREGYFKFREDIMDSKIPVAMPIGFKMVSSTSIDLTTAIDRNSSCLESMVAISANLKDIIFAGKHNQWIQSEQRTGVVNTGNANFRSNDQDDIQAVDKSTHLYTAIDPVRIRFFVHKAAGYRPMKVNAKVDGMKGFFPLNTSHSLLTYIRVLPFNGKDIRVTYHRGMTPELFKRILEGAYE